MLKTLSDQKQERGTQTLTPPLRQLYDGDLQFPAEGQEPYVIANFVSTLDGVISFSLPGIASGAEISGSDEADHFVMGLLRASADAIMIGARTIHDVEPDSLWTAEFAHPASRRLYEDYRINPLGKPRFPIVVVLSGSGHLELERAVFRTPDVRVLIVSTAAGRDALTKAGAARMSNVEVLALDAVNGNVDLREVVQLLFSKYQVRLLLHEGGPKMFARFLEAKLVHELFLTLSPQIAGREADSVRPGLLEGLSFLPSAAPWFELMSTKGAGSHLFLRYRYSGPRAAAPQK
ncbi:MAG TPA: dihydrofolate reductase family protein [Acidobacteriaceae bacterium]|nr:dihydrofolate reductase family protein [Acidobacteriaceae bacterium]